MTHDKPDSFGAYGATSWPDAEADPPTLDAAPVPQPPRPEVYSLREVAAIFGRTERTIRSWVKAGHLQRGGFGNALFFSRAAIEALLNGRRES
jgi:Helix-turn-helix domain